MIVQQMTPEELEQCTTGGREGEAFAVMTREQTQKMKEVEERLESEEASAQGAATQLNMEEPAE